MFYDKEKIIIYSKKDKIKGVITFDLIVKNWLKEKLN